MYLFDLHKKSRPLRQLIFDFELIINRLIEFLLQYYGWIYFRILNFITKSIS